MKAGLSINFEPLFTYLPISVTKSMLTVATWVGSLITLLLKIIESRDLVGTNVERSSHVHFVRFFFCVAMNYYYTLTIIYTTL